MQVTDFDVAGLAAAVAAELAEKLRAEDQRLLDRRALAGRLGLSERGVTGLVKRHELPAGFLIGGVRRWDWQEVLRYLSARCGRSRRRGRGVYDRNQLFASGGESVAPRADVQRSQQ